jgi:hypothetical protein
LANTDHVGVGRPLGLIHGKEREMLQVVHGTQSLMSCSLSAHNRCRLLGSKAVGAIRH